MLQNKLFQEGKNIFTTTEWTRGEEGGKAPNVNTAIGRSLWFLLNLLTESSM